MNQNKVYIEIMIESLERKKACLQELLALAEKQSALLQQKKFDNASFVETIEAMKPLADKVQQIEDGFGLLYDKQSEEFKQKPIKHAEALEHMQNLILESITLNNEIEKLNEANHIKLEERYTTKLRKKKRN